MPFDEIDDPLDDEIHDAIDDEAVGDDGSKTAGPPRHWTREPWQTIPLSGLVVVLLTLWNYGRLKHNLPQVGVIEAIGVAGGLALCAAAILVVRSHVRSVFWSHVVLCCGMLLVALGLCGLLVWLG